MYIRDCVENLKYLLKKPVILYPTLLGLAVLTVSLTRWLGRNVSWIQECLGVTEKVAYIRRKILTHSAITASSLPATQLKEVVSVNKIEQAIKTARLSRLTEDEQFGLLIEQAVHEIIPGLFLGGSDYSPHVVHRYDGTQEPVEYQQIISATHWTTQEGFKPSSTSSIFKFPADSTRTPPDVTLASLRGPALQEALGIIDSALAKGQNVFVHCQQGKDRSATVVIAYIMSKYQVSFETALTFVRSRRWMAEPGEQYLEFLRTEFQPVRLSQ